MSTDIEDRLEQTPEGYWVLKNESHLNGWIRETKRLDHDRTVDALCKYIKKDSLVIDVGANIGTHTCAYLNAVGEKGMVIAYEPHPVHYECLIRNCPQAIALNTAASDKHGTAFLIEESANTGASFLSDRPSSTRFEVETTTIDDDITRKIGFGRPLSFIKIDVEGCEVEVLRGAAKMIARFRPVMYVEINQEHLARRGHTARDVRHFLNNNRYRWRFNGGEGWNFPQTDILCIPL